MFTNKNKLIGFIALIVVVVLVASAAIALIADSQLKQNAAETNAQLQAKLDKLQAELDAANSKLNGAQGDLDAAESTIATLKSELAAAKSDLASAKGDLTDAKNRVKELEDKLLELITNWAAATPEVHEAVQAIGASYEAALLNAYLLPNGALDNLNDVKMDAIYAAIRSTSTDELDAVVDGFNAAIAEIEKDRFDNVLRDMIDAVLVDGVTHPEDVDGVKACEDYLASFVGNTAVYDKFVALGLDVEVAGLRTALNADEKKDLGDAFVAAVALIPEYVQLTDAGVVEAARDAYKALNDKYPVVAGERADVDEAFGKLLDAEQRLLELPAIIADAEAINALIESAIAAAKADSATRDVIVTIGNKIAAWEANENSNDPVWNLIDRQGYETLKGLYAKAIADLEGLFNEFKAAVEAIGNVTPNSGDAINAAHDADAALVANTEFKELLGATIAAEYDSLLAVLNAADVKFAAINDLIARIRLETDRLYASEPIKVSQAEVDALNVLVTELTTVLGQELEVINVPGDEVTYVAKLEYVNLIPHKNAALAKIDQLYAIYKDKVNNEFGGNWNFLYEITLVNEKLHGEVLAAKSYDEIVIIENGMAAQFDACLVVNP